jgi:fucose 4-O-acetylase-like acetyltransferase
MHGLATPLYWLVRRWTGYRLYHVVALVIVLLVTLGGLAIPFWWLGEQAESVAGLTGFVIVSLLYLYAAALVLAFAAIVVARSVVRRLRKLFQAGRPGSRPAVDWPPVSRAPVDWPPVDRRSNAPPLSR